MLSYFVCKIFVDLKTLIIFPAILGYQFVQSEKMLNLLPLIACNKPHHVKVSKPVVHLRWEPNMHMKGAFSLIVLFLVGFAYISHANV